MDINTTVGGRYLVVAEIGRGGMGVVLRVRDATSGDEVALKYCVSGDEEHLRRFAREVRGMAATDHRHVMPVLDQDLAHAPPYFIMPIAQGSIAEELVAGMTVEAAIDVVLQACLGVQAIHNANGTHRDLKPLNLMRMLDGRVVVSDLGLIKLEPRDTTTLTQTTAFLGTRAYCAPEQIGGSRDADQRTDIYQLGKTLYEMVTGEPPALIDPDKLPRALGLVIGRATRELPALRYQTVGAFMDALNLYLQSTRPDASPSQTFEIALAEAIELIKHGECRQDNMEVLLTTLIGFADDAGTLIDQLARIPDPILGVMAHAADATIQPMLEAYIVALESRIGSYNYPYAETVAAKMAVIFNAARRPQIKALAAHAALLAAVRLNRYAAMEMFDRMLLSLSQPDDAIAVAELLRENLALYAVVADRIPRVKLHAALRPIFDEAAARNNTA